MKHIPEVSSTRIRAGLYMVGTDAGRTLHVEQVDTDTPGYGKESLWWVTAVDSAEDPTFDPFHTKADALQAIRDTYTVAAGYKFPASLFV